MLKEKNGPYPKVPNACGMNRKKLYNNLLPKGLIKGKRTSQKGPKKVPKKEWDGLLNNGV